MRRPALAVAALALLGAGCGKSDSTADKPAAKGAQTTEAAGGTSLGAAKPTAKVPIASFRFVPASVTVKRGGTVTWTNRDKAPHTATAEDKSFDTGTLETGDGKTETFSKAGTYRYYCVFHRFMEATVVVK